MRKEYPASVRDAFFELLRCGLWEREPDLSLFENLDTGLWDELYHLIGEQAVTGICFSPLKKLPAGLLPPRMLYLSWFARVEFIRNKNIRMHDTILELNARFESAGIYPVLLKGLGLASWYPEPDLRMTGDIDLYIPDTYKEAVDLVKSWGYVITYMPQHDKFEYNGFWVELHHSFINPPGLLDVSDDLIYMTDSQVYYCIPGEDAGTLLLLTHAAKHLFGPGVGVRRLCDWSLFLFHNDQAIHYDRVWKQIRKVGLERFVVEFTALAVDYLGLDVSVAGKWMEGSRKKMKLFLLNDMLKEGDRGSIQLEERGRIGESSSYLIYVKRWICFYGGFFYRQLLIYPYWPGFVRKYVPPLVWRRLRFVLQGRALAEK